MQMIGLSGGAKGVDGEGYKCVYSGSGKTPLLCGGGAFLALGIGMVVEHTYMLVAVSKSAPPALLAPTLTLVQPRLSHGKLDSSLLPLGN